MTLEQSLVQAFTHALDTFEMPADQRRAVAVTLGPPRIAAHGDLATSVALPLAKVVRRPPLEVAQQLVVQLQARLAADGTARLIERVEVKPPGFINLFLSRAALHEVLSRVLADRGRYGRCEIGRGTKTQVEFVSANPTGPLSVAHGRQAAVGDALANLLDFAGYAVTREYYLNDEGTQMEVLGQSLLARYLEALGEPSAFPEAGYKGAYLQPIAARVVQEVGRRWAADSPERTAWFFARAQGEILAIIRQELADFGVRFDEWSPQSSLRTSGQQDEAMALLKDRGYLYEQDGAWWLKSTAFGDDKDRVVVRSDGRPTYIAADIAYHREKYRRGFQRLINLWGPDHHGYIPRMMAAIQALGYEKTSLTVLIIQLCTLRRGAETIPMSTREGEFVTLRQVIEEVGRDAARFFFLMRTLDSHLDFDLALAKTQAPENPVYYVQYAHARIAGILAKAAQSASRPAAEGALPD
ncbi:MAG: arginine--tRNA ligase, partial [Candidatus Omnitrophica bacterium]|nr:arginine--tRNA ligase [Candidatus Omnitrophota bacterium]